jgi:phage terminase small subunit
VALNNKQRAFVEHYLTCWNATEAARRAGYSVKTAQEQGSRLLSNVIVQTAITARLKDVQAGADEVLTRLTSHSRGNMDDFLSSMGLIDLVKARDLGVMPLVKKIKQRTTTISKEKGEDIETHEIELELYDAQAATVQLARILGQFVSRVEIYDWRKKLEEQGVDPSAIFERIVQAAAETLARTDGVGSSHRGQTPALGDGSHADHA